VVYPGVRDTLKWLHKQGVEMALITNKPERFVAPLLDQMKIGRYFRWIIGGDTLPQKKPDPAALFFVMKMANIPASQSLFVGDSRSDVLAAKAAGVQVRGAELRLQPWPADRRGIAGTGDRRSAQANSRLLGSGAEITLPDAVQSWKFHRGGHSQTLDESHQGPGPLALARLTFLAGLPARLHT
jgi:phosphoglycolate phosphatase